ncbi:MAG: hypothetical protein ACO1TE_18395 [Prosthecobacter sp.]
MEKSLLRYVLRRKGLLAFIFPALLGVLAWGQHRVAEQAAQNAVQSQVTRIGSEMEMMRKLQVERLGAIESKQHELIVLIDNAKRQSADSDDKVKKLDNLLPDAAKTAELLGEAEKLRGQLSTMTEISKLSGDVNRIIESLKKDESLHRQLTESVSTQIGGKFEKIEAELKSVLERVATCESQVLHLKAHPLIGGVPYRAAHLEEDEAKDYVAVHQAAALYREVGRVFHDTSSNRAQFYRLSTSTSHTEDDGDRVRIPRCHVLFRGWLPEKALKTDALSSREEISTMLELKENLSEDERRLREEPGYDKRSLAIFDGHRMPFFITGNRDSEWLEVTFEGWMAVTNGRPSNDSRLKTYILPALP